MTHWVAMALLGAVLVSAGVWDWRTGRVPNALTYPAILIGLAWAAAGAWLGGASHAGASPGEGLMLGLVGLGAGIVPFYVLFVVGGLGGGDAKLMGAVGAISASWQCVLATTVYAFVVAAGMAVFIMVRHGLVKQTAARLFGAALLSTARVKPDLPDDSPRVPFAVAIALGGLVAGAEVLLGLDTPWAAFGP